MSTGEMQALLKSCYRRWLSEDSSCDMQSHWPVVAGGTEVAWRLQGAG